MQRTLGSLVVLALLVPSASLVRGEDDFEREPIRYSQATPDNIVSRLWKQVETKPETLPYEDYFGYLPALLKALDVPVSSQTLVFSKTSLQRPRIAPQTPRALYFNDDIYVGFCQHGDVLELSVADPQLGTVFYTLDQEADARRLTRQTDNCLLCHGSSHTRGVPGHMIRSVYPDRAGQPILSSGTYRIDHTSPLEQRWGGWYVTGTHGAQKHLGNFIVTTRDAPRVIDNPAGMNLTRLDDRIDTSAYLAPHSDLAALMVLEHQVEAHNRLTRASFTTRQALYQEQQLNRELKMPPEHRWPSTDSRIRSVVEPLVEYLLMGGEVTWTEPLRGTSTFAAEFSRRGPQDGQGRSLRQLDLSRRLFRYPCSYLVYSESFAALPEEARRRVLARFDEVLSGRDTSPTYAHLSADDRRAVREILLSTLPAARAAWGKSPAAPATSDGR